MVIPDGAVGREKLTGEPSGSVAATAYWYTAPLARGGDEVMTGGWLGGSLPMTRSQLCIAVPPWPSSTATAMA